VKWWLVGETKVLGENLPQCHFVHHKPHVLCRDGNTDCLGVKPATNLLSYGKAGTQTLQIKIEKYSYRQKFIVRESLQISNYASCVD
jgi:hypothetical protein